MVLWIVIRLVVMSCGLCLCMWCVLFGVIRLNMCWLLMFGVLSVLKLVRLFGVSGGVFWFSRFGVLISICLVCYSGCMMMLVFCGGFECMCNVMLIEFLNRLIM